MLLLERAVGAGRALVTAARHAVAAHPLLALVLLGAVLRAVAACFSKGYLASDDHHVVVRRADLLASGIPLSSTYRRSILYPGVMALVMAALRALGNASPDVEMLVIRLLHAGLAVPGIYFAFRILEATTDRQTAIWGGLLMATFYALPVTSVHQLEETVCQVPLLASCWWLVRADRAERGARILSFCSGAALGVALVLRLPLLAFVLPLAGLALYRRARRHDPWSFPAGLALVILLQGVSNLIVNGELWYSFTRTYGPLFSTPGVLLTESGGYPRGPVWRYAGTLVALFLPPFSPVFLAAAIRGGRALPLLGVPALLFLVAHSLMANKQERFLLPIVPVLLLLGAAGLPAVQAWFANRLWTAGYRWLWRYFWGLNTALLLGSLFVYAKKDRVEPLVRVAERGDARGVIVAQYSYRFGVPEYYLGRPRPRLFVFRDRRDPAVDVEQLGAARGEVNYLVLYSDSLDADRALLQRALGRRLVLETVVAPSFGDRLAHAVNPRRNKAREAAVFSLP